MKHIPQITKDDIVLTRCVGSKNMKYWLIYRNNLTTFVATPKVRCQNGWPQNEI